MVRVASRRAGVAALLLSTLLAGCGGGRPGPDAVIEGEVLAALDVIDTRTDWRDVGAEDYVEAVDGQGLVAGDGVRTDDTGFAEVAYADGSLTRLEPSTEFAVVSLAGDATLPEIRVELDTGRVWNRVNTVTGTRGKFEVETSVGVAAVRGTAFGVECNPADVCTFTVTDGFVVVTTPDGRQIEIRAGETVTLGREGGGTGGTGGAGGAGTGGDGSGGTTDSDASGGGTDGSSGTTDGGSTDGGANDGDTTDGGTTDGGTSGGDTDGSGGTNGSGTDGGADGQTDGSNAGDGTGTSGTRIIETDRRTIDEDDPGIAWVGSNTGLDPDRYGDEREACSVTVGGRNVDYASTPDTAIEVDVDEIVRVDAVATGELDSYEVRLRMAGLEFQAAQGEVLADESGDRTGFRGDIEVGEYARWGVGLYEVVATTTGTPCSVTAYIDVVGRSPLLTVGGIAGLLLSLGGLAGLVSAFGQTTSPEQPSPLRRITDTLTFWR